MNVRNAVAAAALMLVPVAGRAADTGPVGRIGAYDDAIIAVMKQRLPLKGRVERFRSLVETYYDMPAIAALVIGPVWASTSTADRSAMTAALTRHSAISLAQNFASFGGERFVVDPVAQPRGTGSIVKLSISSHGSSNLLLFRMQRSGGNWKIVDVVADGVSQAAVQRSDLAGTVAAGGVAAVVKRLDQVDAKAVR